ncbi:MAG: TIGR04282 family arsenosugar biosynthesis glycosyltransferase [Syntrophobacteraceae bacterium]
MSHSALLIFLRYPDAGKVKRRLSEEIGSQRAAEVYEKLIRRTLGVACDFKRRAPEARIVLFHTPHDPVEKLKNKFRGPWEFWAQDGEHLGMRMANALRTAFATGARKAVLIGTDLSDIEAKDIEGAFRNIGEKTAVLGPAADGGFYLIGTDRPIGAPFHFSSWGTGEVFTRTARELEAAGFRIHLTAERHDVDCKRDLDPVDRDFLFDSSLSIIIPTLADPQKLSPLLLYLESSLWPGDEIVVAQGGAFEKAALRRISPSLAVVSTRKGRGIQQNAGAILSRGTILFFLHDDTVPPPEFPYLIRRACRDYPAALGCFKLRFLPSNRALGLIAAWANLRTALFKLPYGDQGLFCRREIFERAGGFGRSYLMEDVDLVGKFRKMGKGRSAISILPVPVYSSPDRYLHKGIIKASLLNHSTFLLAALGRDERILYRKYYGLETRDLLVKPQGSESSAAK